MTEKYPNCGECPAEFREDCPFYEPNTDDNPCIYEFLRARREREEKEKSSRWKKFQRIFFIFFQNPLDNLLKICYNIDTIKERGKNYEKE